MSAPDFEQAWVLWAKYSDSPGAEIYRVYLDEARATADLELACKNAYVTYVLTSAPIYK